MAYDIMTEIEDRLKTAQSWNPEYYRHVTHLMTRIQQMQAVIQVARSRLRDLPASATAVAIDDTFADLLGEPRVNAPKRTDWGI